MNLSKIKVYAELWSFLEETLGKCFAFFSFSRAHKLLLGSWTLCISKTAVAGWVFFTSHHSHWLLLPASTLKKPCNYSGTTQIIQGNLSVGRVAALISVLNLNSLLPCNTTYSDSRVLNISVGQDTRLDPVKERDMLHRINLSNWQMDGKSTVSV